MTSDLGILRLMSWLSPVFPTGGFAYSSGLETSVQRGLVCNQADLCEWLKVVVSHGSAKNDAIFLAQAWEKYRDYDRLQSLTELALAMAGSGERYLETTSQADAFSKAVENWPVTSKINIPRPSTLPIIIGVAAGVSGLNLSQTILAYLQSIVINQTQAAIRLSVVGQKAAAEILAQLETTITNTAADAQDCTLDDLGTSTIMAEIMAMQHEELQGRMFRS